VLQQLAGTNLDATNFFKARAAASDQYACLYVLGPLAAHLQCKVDAMTYTVSGSATSNPAAALRVAGDFSLPDAAPQVLGAAGIVSTATNLIGCL
jgi:hypothetical protein